MKQLSRLLILLLFFCSCEETKKEKMESLVSKWEGKVIAFPSHSVFTVQGNDTIDFYFSCTNYRIVTYVDSLECACDDLKLGDWKTFMQITDSLTQNEAHFIFYFNTKERDKLRYFTLRDQFTYPICFDDENLFYKLNQLSTDLPITTFLLDANDKVITMGDPINDSDTRKQFWNIMASATK